MTIGQAKLDPMQRLAAAIIMQAALDARAGDIGALAWLKSDQALELVDFIGMDWLTVQRWTKAAAANRINGPKTDICPT